MSISWKERQDKTEQISESTEANPQKTKNPKYCKCCSAEVFVQRPTFTLKVWWGGVGVGGGWVGEKKR